MKVKAPSKIGRYTLRGVVGDGAFSVVKLAYDEQLCQYFACKIVPKSRLTTHHLEERFEVEIRINQRMNHPGVVKLIDILKDTDNYYVIMEFCPNGELFQYIVDRGRLTEEEAKPKVIQLLETVKYIHSVNVSHRDLKPENILIDQLGQLKISDFGLGRFLDKNDLISTPCGSPCYASPECISGKPYNGKTTDIWSCGVIVYAMMTGQLPWTKRNQSELFAQIRSGNYTVPKYLSPQCASFIKGLMTVDISERMTVDDALAHPWLASTPPFVFTPINENIAVSIRKVDEFFNPNIVYNPSDDQILVKPVTQTVKEPSEGHVRHVKKSSVIKHGTDPNKPKQTKSAKKVTELGTVEVRHRKTKTPTSIRPGSTVHKITKPKTKNDHSKNQK